MVLRKHGGTETGQVLVGSLKHFEVDTKHTDGLTNKYGVQSGRVTGITVTTAGVGYTAGAITVNISAPDLPDGVQATATVPNVPSGGAVETNTAFTIVNAGSGYLTAPTVTLTQASGTPTTVAVVTATIADAGESSTVLKIIELISTKSTVVILGETGTNGAGTGKFRVAVESSTPWTADSLQTAVRALGTVDGVNLNGNTKSVVSDFVY